MKTKRIIFIIILIVLAVILFALLMLKTFFQKSTTSQPINLPPISTPSASLKKSNNNPIIIIQNQQEKITVEYFPATSIYYVTIEAQTVAEYKEKTKKAVALLKDSGIDPCDDSLYWPTPANLKKDLTLNDSNELHQITCPSRTLTLPTKP